MESQLRKLENIDFGMAITVGWKKSILVWGILPLASPRGMQSLHALQLSNTSAKAKDIRVELAFNIVPILLIQLFLSFFFLASQILSRIMSPQVMAPLQQLERPTRTRQASESVSVKVYFGE